MQNICSYFSFDLEHVLEILLSEWFQFQGDSVESSSAHWKHSITHTHTSFLLCSRQNTDKPAFSTNHSWDKHTHVPSAHTTALSACENYVTYEEDTIRHHWPLDNSYVCVCLLSNAGVKHHSQQNVEPQQYSDTHTDIKAAHRVINCDSCSIRLRLCLCFLKLQHKSSGHHAGPVRPSEDEDTLWLWSNVNILRLEREERPVAAWLWPVPIMTSSSDETLKWSMLGTSENKQKLN